MSRLSLTITFIFIFILCLIGAGAVFASTINKTPAVTVNLNSGLVGWWTFDGADVNATKVLDKSGSANHGTRTGGVAMSSGKLGQAGKFDGADDYVDAGNNNSLQITGTTISIGAWIKTTDSQGAIVARALTADPWEGYGFAVGGNGTTGKLAFWYGNGTGWGLSNSTVNDGKWHYVAIVFDSSNSYFYIDGILNAKVAKSGTVRLSSAINLYIGKDTIVAGREFNGSIDDVRVYNRVLSAKEITQLYQQGGGKLNKTPTATVNLNSGLVGWWTFDGADVNATKVLDKSGSANHGTRTGGVAMSSGKLGQAGKFDGADDYLNAGNVGSLRSVAFWLNDSNAADGILELVNDFTYISISGGAISLNGFTNATTYINGLVGSALSSGWNFVSVVFDSASATGFNIGEANNDFLNGKIDDVRVYNRALSFKEITQLYQQGGGKLNKTPSATVNLNSGLVGWWTFDGADTGMNGSTFYTLDKSGNGNKATNSTAANIPTKKTGKTGQALYFDGANDLLSISDATSLKPSQISLAVWVNPSTMTGNDSILGKTTTYDWNDGYGLDFYTNRSNVGSRNIFFWVNNYGITYTTVTSVVGATISANKWTHVAGTYDLNSMKIYLNGVLVESRSYSTSLTNSNAVFEIGRMGGSDTYNYNGKLDDVRVYNRALSAKEITQLYQMGK